MNMKRLYEAGSALVNRSCFEIIFFKDVTRVWKVLKLRVDEAYWPWLFLITVVWKDSPSICSLIDPSNSRWWDWTVGRNHD